jgi:D-sedoheptulose 7-phosphate isomerase
MKGDAAVEPKLALRAAAGRAAVARHFDELAELAQRVAVELGADIAATAELVASTLEDGGKLLFCGNGGSAADAQHLAAEYVVRFQRSRRPLAAIALTTDTSLLTAAANDFGFAQVFARQVAALGVAGDVLFLHSTSGDSPNLVAAAMSAREAGVLSVGLLARGGGRLRECVDRAIIVPTDSGAHAQELHMAIGHIICDLVDQRFGGGGVNAE